MVNQNLYISNVNTLFYHSLSFHPQPYSVYSKLSFLEEATKPRQFLSSCLQYFGCACVCVCVRVRVCLHLSPQPIWSFPVLVSACGVTSIVETH